MSSPASSSGSSSFFEGPNISKASTSVEEFHEVLRSSKRVLALCGAGLSAASGLATFRGAGGMWRNYQATSLATPEAFKKDPGLVWLFYAHRRHKALEAKPNAGHYALTELAKKLPEFLDLTQNIDGLSQRALHPPDQLKFLHGSLFDIKCFNESCDYTESNNFDDPFHPSIPAPTEEDDRLNAAKHTTAALIKQLDPATPPAVPVDALPHCPKCKTGLLRPAVVWFGEALPRVTLREINAWIREKPIDLMLVIGTTATVWPAAGYVQEAQDQGARIAVVNMDSKELGAAGGLTNRDFLFEGDASRILPEILKPVIGELDLSGERPDAAKK